MLVQALCILHFALAISFCSGRRSQCLNYMSHAADVSFGAAVAGATSALVRAMSHVGTKRGLVQAGFACAASIGCLVI